jgi:CHAT domain-containing protein
MKKKRYDVKLLAFGDPDFSLFSEGKGSTLANLPYSRVEVERISSLVDDDDQEVFLGSEASESNLRAALDEDTARILHLATHGLIDPAEPASSSIVLCPDTETGDDGYLHTLEILSLPVDAELVVLSACESARGTLARGEGVVGLSRAFIASGARGVLASLWAVSDESTSELMSVFYERIYKKKKPTAEALAEARRSLIKNDSYGHPFHWSCFTLTGAGKAK